MGETSAGWLSPLLGGIISLSLGVTGLIVAYWGDGISGDLPFISDEINSLFGRIFFAFGGLLCVGISVIAFRKLFDKLRNKESNSDARFKDD